MKPRWADSCILNSQLHYTVCTTERMFRQEMRNMGYSKEMIRDTHWLAGAGGCVRKFDNAADDGRDILLVCLKPIPDNPAQMVGLIVHEAVHVFQYILQALGEKEPSSEMEAYGIQAVFLNLMEEYSRQTAPKKRKRKK